MWGKILDERRPEGRVVSATTRELLSGRQGGGLPLVCGPFSGQAVCELLTVALLPGVMLIVQDRIAGLARREGRSFLGPIGNAQGSLTMQVGSRAMAARGPRTYRSRWRWAQRTGGSWGAGLHGPG